MSVGLASLTFAMRTYVPTLSLSSITSWIIYYQFTELPYGPVTSISLFFSLCLLWVNGPSSCKVTPLFCQSNRNMHWAWAYISVTTVNQVHLIWISGIGCTNLQTRDQILLATYIYSTCLDTVIIALSAWKLFSYSRVVPKSRFLNILFRDGLVYYAFAWVFLCDISWR